MPDYKLTLDFSDYLHSAGKFHLQIHKQNIQLSQTVVRNYGGFSNQGKSAATSTLSLYNFRSTFHLLKLNLTMCHGQSSQVSWNMALKNEQQHTWSSRLVQCSGCCWTIQLFLLQSITPFCSECWMLRLSSEEHFALLVLLKRKRKPQKLCWCEEICRLFLPTYMFCIMRNFAFRKPQEFSRDVKDLNYSSSCALNLWLAITGVYFSFVYYNLM